MAIPCPRALSRKSLRLLAGEAPVVSGSEAVKALGKAGYELDEQHGSHIILRRTDPPKALVREAGLTVEEFTCLL